MSNRHKSIFISVYPTAAFAAVGFSIYHMMTYGFSYSYMGLLLCAFPILMLLTVFFGIGVARTTPNLWMYSAIAAMGLFLSVIGLIDRPWNHLAFVGSVLMGFGWVAYVQWYSVFENREKNMLLEKGKPLPAFTLEDALQQPVHSRDFKGKRSIIMFFRGNWCPLCMAQIKELAAMYKELEQKNIQTILISPQPHSHTRSLASKFDLDFIFLGDKDNQVARQLNIFAENGLPLGLEVLGYDSDTVMPTIILTDENGIVLHTDLTSNYRIRPEPRAFLEVFEKSLHL